MNTRVTRPTSAPVTARWRSWRTVQLLGVTLLVAAGLTVGLSTRATAIGSGSTITTAIETLGTVTAGTPYSSGQEVDIVIPANSVLTPTAINVNMVECQAPGGVVPTDPAACDGETIQGASIHPNPDGSVDLHTETNSLYTLYAIPDLASLGETSGPVCNLTNECVLYIGQNQNDFTQPHFWSSPFYINPNGGVDSGANPGDGSPPPISSAPSASASTVVGSAATATADGADPVTVTVTLLDTYGVPVPGKTVDLAQGSGHSTITPNASPEVSDSNGVATFTATDAATESVTYTATDTTDSIQLDQQATVGFQTPTVSPSHSTVVASPASVALGGSSTVTVTLKDQAATPQPLANKQVTLTGSGSTVIGSPNPATTDAQGVVAFSVTDDTAETVTYSARDATDNVGLSATPTVTFGTLSVSAATSSVVGVSPSPVGSFGTQVTVTLLSVTSSPVPGKEVTLSSSSTTVTITPESPPNLTGTDGVASFTVTDSVPENGIVFTANDATDNLPLTQTATVSFELPTPSPTNSTLTESLPTAPADGSTQVAIFVTIRDQFDNVLSGKVVNLQANTPSSVQFHPIQIGGSGTAGTTNSAGTAQFEADDEAAETVTFTAIDTTDNVHVNASVSVTYVAGPANAATSTVASSPSSVPADGTTASTVTVTLKDHFGNAVAGKAISLAAQPSTTGSVIHAIHATTDASGDATFSVTDSTDEVVSFVATDTTDSLPLDAQGVVTFGNPPAPPPVLADSDVVADQGSVPADGSSSATVTVLLYGASGNPVAGKSVSLNASGGSSVITPMTGSMGIQERPAVVTGTSGSNGQAQFAVTDSTTESVTYTATDTTDNMPLTGLSVTISFTAVQAGTSTSTTTTTVPGSSGSTSTTTTSTTPPAVPAATGGATPSGDTGTGASGTPGGGAAAPTLAYTGSPSLLPWLFGAGTLLLVIGTLGRRLLTRRSR